MTQRHSKKYSRTISVEPPSTKEKQAPNIEGQLIAEESSEEGKVIHENLSLLAYCDVFSYER